MDAEFDSEASGAALAMPEKLKRADMNKATKNFFIKIG